MANMNIICLLCNHYRTHEARGLCHTCYGKVSVCGALERFPKRGRTKATPDGRTYRQEWLRKRPSGRGGRV